MRHGILMDGRDDAIMRGRALAIVLLLVAMLIWGSTYVVTKGGVEDAPPMLFALLRYCVASVLLVTFALLRGGRATLVHRVSWTTLLLMGLTGVALYYTGFNLALTYTTASQGALVQSSVPAVTAVMAVVWLREHLSTQRLVGIGLAIAGVLLVVTGTTPGGGASSQFVGNLLMFGTVVVWGIYTMLAKRVAGADPVGITAAIAVIGTVLLVPGALVEATYTRVPRLSVETWLRILYLGAFPSAVSYLLYNRALRDLEASVVGAFTNLAPVIGAVSGVLVLGEAMPPAAIVGGALALAGVWMSARREPSTEPSTATARR
jgi:drug/metabolite transporter (DMT)-like permease